MSIYATLWSIQIHDPASPFTSPRWVKVTAQAVPPHIGSPTPECGYEAGDPYADFLPPPVETDEGGQAPYIPVADDFLRRESDQREDGLRRATFQPEKSNRLKDNLMHRCRRNSAISTSFC